MANFSNIELDARLLRGLLRGDRSAQESAYRLLAPALYGLALRILQDAGLAQEVVHDTFIELIEKAAGIVEAEAVPAWVRRVAVNHCLMRLRSPWNRRRVAALVPEARDEAVDTEQLQRVRDIESALAALPPETRLVVWLHDVEGYTHEEIAELVGRTASYSKSKLARGYRKLTQLFEGGEDAKQTVDIRSAGCP